MASGVLYVVATPIGNLNDVSVRLRDTLEQVDLIAAEDTRHSGHLLKHLQIRTPMQALHDHNERQQLDAMLARLEDGQNIALISDAGTPLLSDPGFHLVRQARQRGMLVSPVPGPSALTAALSAAGLPTDRFVFEGFLTARGEARRKRLDSLAAEARTLVFFEAPHRVLETLEDMAGSFGADREAAFGREITKTYEEFRAGTLGELSGWFNSHLDHLRGEFVLLVHGAAEQTPASALEAQRVLDILLAELPLKQAAILAARITGSKKNQLYKAALAKQSS